MFEYQRVINNQGENTLTISFNTENDGNIAEHELDSNIIIEQLCEKITTALHEDPQTDDAQAGKEEETLEYQTTAAINLVLPEEISNVILPLSSKNHYQLIQALKPFFLSVDSKNIELKTTNDEISPDVDPTIRNLFENHENFKKVDAFNTKFQQIITARDQLFLNHGVDRAETETNPWEELFANFINAHCLCVPAFIPTVSYFGLNITDNHNLLIQTDVIGFEQFMHSIYKAVDLNDCAIFEKKFWMKCSDHTLIPVTIEQFLNTIEHFRQEFDRPFPFEELEIDSQNNENINLNEHWPKLINFLANNPQLNFVRLNYICDIDENNLELFIKALAENNIRSSIHLRSNTAESLHDAVNNQILVNRRRHFINNPVKSNTNTPAKKLARLNIPPSWDKPRVINTHDLGLSTQYEHAMQHVVNTESISEQERFNTLINERLTNIEAEQEQEQELLLNPRPRYSKLIDRNNIVELCQGINRNIFRNDLLNIWDNIVGKKSSCVKKISLEAMKKILSYSDAFESGLMLTNLPTGFYLADIEGGLVLCYESAHKHETNDLTVKLINQKPQFITEGKPEQFKIDNPTLQNDADEFEAVKESFNNYIHQYYQNREHQYHDSKNTIQSALFHLLHYMPLPNEENKTTQEIMQQREAFVKEIEIKYADILESFNRQDLVAIRSIVLGQGAIGLDKFLGKLHALHQNDPNLYKAFYRCFISKKENLIDLTKQNVYEDIDYLLYELNDPTERLWWINLSELHADSGNVAHLHEMIKAFQYFCEKTKGINLPYPNITGASNFHIALDRILTIINNAPNRDEQLAQIGTISLGQEDAYFAIRNEKFRFVSNDMELTPDKSREENNLRYALGLNDFAELAQNAQNFQRIKPHFYRYIGLQRYTMPYVRYQNIVKILENTAVHEDKKILLLPLIAKATTGEAGIRVLPESCLENIVSLFSPLEVHTREAANQSTNENIALKKVVSLLPSLNDTSMTIVELYGLLQFALNNKLFSLNSRKYQIFLDKYQQDGLKILINCGGMRNKDEELDTTIQRQLSFLGNMEALLQSTDANSLPAELHGKLLLATSYLTIHSDDIENETQTLLNTLKTLYEEDANQCEAILTVIATINSHETPVFPTSALMCEILSEPTITAIDVQGALQRASVLLKKQTQNRFDYNCKALLLEVLNEIDTENSSNLISSSIKANKPLIQGWVQSQEMISIDFLIEQLTNNNMLSLLQGRILKKLSNGIQQTLENQLDTLGLSKISEHYHNDLFSLFTKKLGALDTDNANTFIEKYHDCKEFIVSLERFQEANSRSDLRRVLDALLSINFQNAKLSSITELLNDEIAITVKIELLTFFAKENYGCDEQTELTERVKIIAAASPSLAIKTLNIIQNNEGFTSSTLSYDTSDTDSQVTSIDDSGAGVGLGAGSTMDNFNRSETSDTETNQPDSFNTTIDLLDSLTKLLNYFSMDNPDELTGLFQPLLNQFKNNTPAFVAIADKLISCSTDENKLALLKIINGSIHNGKYKDKKNYNTTLQDDLNDLITFLSKTEAEDLQNIAAVYTSKPYPNARYLVAKFREAEISQNAIDFHEIIDKFDTNPFENRDPEKITQQFFFNSKEVQERISHIIDLTNNTLLSDDRQGQLLQYFEIINDLGPTIAFDSRNKINEGLILCQQILKDNNTDGVDKTNSSAWQHINPLLNHHFRIKEKPAARILLLAYLREIYYRTSPTGKEIFANPTQLINVLQAIEDGGNVISGIETGQGKSLVSAFEAAMLWFEKHTVDICTSDSVVAKEDWKKSRDFFHYLGIKTNCITANSSAEDYELEGINYSDISNLSLYRSKINIEGKIAEISPENIDRHHSMIGDEIDKATYDETTQFILSEPSSDLISPDAWIYPLVNDFVDYLDGELTVTSNNEDELSALQNKIKNCFKHDPHSTTPSIAEEVLALRKFLANNSRTSQQNFSLVRPEFHLQLNQWIINSRQARKPLETQGSEWKPEEFEKDANYQTTILLDPKTALPKFGSKWSNGVQQLFHARLNANLEPNEKEFVIEPETHAIAAMNCKNMFDVYLQNPENRILGLTGTPGTQVELAQNILNYEFTAYHFPSHHQSKRVVRDDIFAKDEQSFYSNINKVIRRHGSQPLLILVEDLDEADKMMKLLRANFGETKTIASLTARELIQAKKEKNQDLIDNSIKAAGAENHILISTFTRRAYHIEPRHEEGLVVIDTALVNARKEQQGSGRAARQGQKGCVYHIFNRGKFSKKEKLAEQERIANENLLKTRKQQYYSDVASTLQMYFDRVVSNIDTFFTERSEQFDNETLDPEVILDMRKKMLADLSTKWSDILSNTHEENPLSQINHSAFIFSEEAVRYWTGKVLSGLESESVKLIAKQMYREPQTGDLEQQANTEDHNEPMNAHVSELQQLMRDCKREMNLIKDFKDHASVIMTAHRENHHTNNTTNPMIHELDNFTQDFTKLRAGVQQSKGYVTSLYQMYLNRLRLTQINQFDDYRTNSENKLYKLTLRLFENSLDQYLTKWNLSSDRKESARNFRDAIRNMSNGSSPHANWSTLLHLIETAYNGSLEDDIKIESSTFRRARLTSSRYRALLGEMKTWLFSVAPCHQKFTNLAKQELGNLNNAVSIESKRAYYANHADEAAELNVLQTILNNSDDDNNTKISKLRPLFDKIIFTKSPNSPLWHFVQTNSNTNEVLLMMLHHQPGKNDAYTPTNVYNIIRMFSKNPAIKKPGNIFTRFFSTNRVYAIPSNKVFSHLIDNMNELDVKGKYRVHHKLNHLHQQLTDKLHAFDIQYTAPAGELNNVELSFKLFNRETFETTHYKMKVDLLISDENIHFDYPEAELYNTNEFKQLLSYDNNASLETTSHATNTQTVDIGAGVGSPS